jgi:hypothetical protein
MIKFTASGNGRTIIGLGLEPGNIARMQADQPVRVRLADLGFVGPAGTFEIIIFTGPDAATMTHRLKQFIGPDTVIHGEPPT